MRTNKMNMNQHLKVTILMFVGIGEFRVKMPRLLVNVEKASLCDDSS